MACVHHVTVTLSVLPTEPMGNVMRLDSAPAQKHILGKNVTDVLMVFIRECLATRSFALVAGATPRAHMAASRRPAAADATRVSPGGTVVDVAMGPTGSVPTVWTVHVAWGVKPRCVTRRASVLARRVTLVDVAILAWKDTIRF